tara:strand:+ start:6507 stop:7793 length:1287 start_codon:yes stop_codon:yes gene_type:complete
MNDRLHILGVCGKLMSGIAVLAKQSGFNVLGYDKAFLPPMSIQLKKFDINCINAWETDHIKKEDVIIVGNGILFDNPIIRFARARNIKMISGPQWLQENILANKKVIAITGTHGKTTVTSWCVDIFYRLGIKVGYLIGGTRLPEGQSADLGSPESPWFVIEADEYDTAFFDKRPKFLHYWPYILLVNNIEFDHSDIYKDIAEINKQYQYLFRTVHPDGGIVANIATKDLVPDSSYTFSIDGEGALNGLYHKEMLQIGEQKYPVWGHYNAYNLIAVMAIFRRLQIEVPSSIFDNLTLPKRRLEDRGIHFGIRWFDDFAHHSTAILAVYNTLLFRYSQVALIIHPASSTQRSEYGFKSLFKALKGAGNIAILPSKRQEKHFDLPKGWVYVADEDKAVSWARQKNVDAVCVMSCDYLEGIFNSLELEKLGN